MIHIMTVLVGVKTFPVSTFLGSGGVTASEVATALGSVLHIRGASHGGLLFYDAARTALLRNDNTKDKVVHIISDFLKSSKSTFSFFFFVCSGFDTGGKRCFGPGTDHSSSSPDVLSSIRRTN
jgi:hypothetical protein